MSEVGEHSTYPENVNLTKRFDLLATTEFVSVTSIEPMEDFRDDAASLKLSFEESEISVNVPCTVDSSNTARSMLKKKTSFADNLKVVSIFSDNVATAEKPEPVEFIDADRGEVDTNLSEQMETVSISMESEYSGEDEATELKSTEPAARLEQISVRIFATVLPDNETPEQRQCDLVQAQRRIHELTNGSLVLVVNCGEPNTQLVIIFNQVRNCPFDVDGYPDLATFVAFCERVYDWLLVRESHVLLLHAEGIIARTRLLLLLRALASYYETSERYDPHTSEQLRAYIKNYPNGVIRSPVSWLRYSGYMRLFSPENCLSILRATLGIYKLFLHNMPVFEENKLRLFLKFYSGSPLRPVYTTKIYDFYSTNSCDVLIVFSNNADPQASNVGLRLQGDIVLFAYHCRPYPSRRLRLFRLHFHSCQGFFDPITFQHDDFDELCDALPSTVRLELHCTNRTTNDNSKFPLDTRIEQITLSDPFGKQSINSGTVHLRNCSFQQLDGTISPDEAVRLHDSLESIPKQGSAHKTRTVCFRSFEDLDGTSVIGNSHYLLNPFSQHSGLLSPVQAHEPKSHVYDFLHYDSTNLDMTSANRSQPNVNLTKSSLNQNSEFVQRKGLRATFSRVKDTTHKPMEPNCHADTFDRSQLMPPPSSAQVLQSGHKRKRSMRQRFTELISGRRKVQHWDSETDSLGSAIFPITGSEYSVDTSSTDSGRGLLSKLRKAHAGLRGLTTAKLGPPQKSRKVVTTNEMNNEVTDSVPIYHHSEDLLEAARRLNFMAGTQELDRLLEELRLTSMQMTSGLPPVNTSHSPRPYTPYTQSSTQKHSQHGSLGHTQTRFHSTRSSSTIGLYGNQDYGTVHSYSGHPSTYTYQKHSSYQTEKRLDGLSRPAHYPTYRSNLSPAPTPRQHTTYTTVLKQRPPAVPKQFSQVHLTIDPECGTTETSNTSASLTNAREVTSGREQLLESELNSARQELAQLRRAMSMVEERRRHETTHEYHRSPLSPVHLPTVRSSSVPHPYYQHHIQQQPSYHQKQQQHFMSNPSNSYHAQYHGSRSTSSTFQRGSPRQDGIYGGAVGGGFGLSKRAMSQTNVHGPARTWNLRSQHQGSESDLAFKRVTSVSSPIGRSTYSAHRERLKQEREQELLLQQQRQRQIAASSTGLNEAHLHQQSRSQQQYRSLSAVNTGGGSEAVEEIETIILQPIGRGVQDIDSRVGSMTTLPRGPGGSMMDGRVLQTYSPKMLPPRLPAVPRLGTSPVLPPMSWRTRSASPPLPTGHQLANVGSIARHSPRAVAPFLSKTLTYRDNPYKSLPSSTPTPTKGSIAIRDSFAVHPVGPQETLDLIGSDKVATPTRWSPSVGSTSVQPYRSVQLHTVSQPASQGPKDDSEFAILGTKTIRSELNTQTTPPPKIPVSPFDEDNLLKGDELMRKSLEELEKIQNEILDPELGDSRLHRVDDNPRTGLTKRGFSSTQTENAERDVPYLTRQPSNSDLIRPTAIHHSQTMIAPIVTSQPLHTARVDTSSTLVNNAQNGQFTGSRGQLSTTSSTIIAPATSSTVIVTPTNNGWKPEPVKRNGAEAVDLTQVQETAPVWYRPNLSRETAISILRQQPPGSFLIRDSTTFKGAFGLAVKVATLPPKVTPKSDDLQSELVRHYLIEVVNSPTRGVRLKGFASEPVFPSLAALIHQHTIDPLALPCRLTLPPITTNLPSSGTAALPPLVIGTEKRTRSSITSEVNNFDNATVASSASVLGASPSEVGSTHTDGVVTAHRVEVGPMVPNQLNETQMASQNVPFVCVLRESPTHGHKLSLDSNATQGVTFRCLMLGSVDTPQWSNEVCFARAIDQLIPLTQLTASECDHGLSRVRYTEVQLHVSAHDGITIIDLQRRLFLRRHLPNHILMYCGVESRKKEFTHPEHQAQGIVHPKIFGITVRKGISECTTHVFTEFDPTQTADNIVQYIRTTYPHINTR